MNSKRNRSVSSMGTDSTVTPKGKSHAESQPEERPGQPETAKPDGAMAEESIRVAAYFLAEQRGFSPGHELDDWLAAEQAVWAMRETSVTAPSVATAAGGNARSARRR